MLTPRAFTGRVWKNHSQHGGAMVGHRSLAPGNATYHAHDANRDVANEYLADRIFKGIVQISIQRRWIFYLFL